MNKTIATIAAAAVAFATVGASLSPASAANYGGAQLIEVAHYSNHQGNKAPPRFEQHGDYAMYNGHRGYRHRHPGYREYNGYWFAPDAFIGAAIGGAILGGILHNAR